MKTYIKIGLIGVLFFVNLITIKAQTQVDISKNWKFIQGDNLEYAQPNFNDSNWKPIEVDKIWEAQGYDPYDGYAWFRTKVVIPSGLKKSAYLKDSLKIFLGKINNFDQVFLNGQLIGENAKNLPVGNRIDTLFLGAPMQMYDVIRRYMIPVNDPRILWDKENTIAVRVFDQGGQGGIYTGNQKIAMATLDEYIVMDNVNRPFIYNDKNVSKTFSIKNTNSKLTIQGTFSITATGKLTGKVLFNKVHELALKPNESKDFSISLENIDQSALITYDYKFSNTKEKFSYKEESPYILTPKASESPKINGAKVYGARTNKPFMFTIAATGIRPMKFDAINLPLGLSVDKKTGIITGRVSAKGEYKVKLIAENAIGKSEGELKIVIGDKIALTPPLGWNSWNCWGLTVDEGKVIASAKVFKEKGLMNHGWTYINIDDGWEIHKDKEPKRDPWGYIYTNEKFPNMKALGDSIHALGLKFGIYSSPGPLTCGGYTASYKHEMEDANYYAYWGVDYLKYDWCSYADIAGRDTSRLTYMRPYLVMRDALNKLDRDIVYSLCQYGMGNVWEWGARVNGNLWRTTGDITDTWESMRDIGFSQVSNQPFAGPGHWNDPDMLVVGWVGWGPNLHPTKLTPDEQYTHISLWSLLSAPLLIGCDLTKLDEFTLNLLTNDEVLSIDQDPLGYQAKQVIKDKDIQVWVKELADGTKAFGIFNLGDKSTKYSLNLSTIGISGSAALRDLWRQKDLGLFTGKYESTIPSHGVVLIKTGK
ncbi:MAG: putative Ig domain-containing protein [Tenuifilaceae bacterium]